MKFALLILLLILSPAARAEKVMFMLNMNYSSNELKALKEVAAKRGQSVVVVPPESLIPQAELLFAARDELEKKIRATRPTCAKGVVGDPSCFTPPQVRSLVGDFMTKGLGSKKDPSITQQFAAEIQTLHQRATAFAVEEKKLPDIETQIKEMATRFTAQGKTFDSVVISAHSDGSNLSGETTTQISSSGVSRLAREVPQLFKDPRHVLLLGCYNMTSTHHNRWRHGLFTNASLLAGFGKRAPSRYRPVSAQYMKDVLGTADQLDQRIVANAPIDKKFLERVFKAFPSITNTQSVIDYCLDIIEGQPGVGKLTCAEQWDDFKARSEIIQREYLDLLNPTVDPPMEANGNDLRDFYSDIQNMCPAKNAPQIPPNQVARAEAYRISLREMAVRLVYWSNVQQNFGTYFSREIGELTKALRAAGISAEFPTLDGSTGRIEFVKKYLAIERALADARNNRALSETQRRAWSQAASNFIYLKPLYNLEGEDSVGESKESAESTLAQGGIPFYWHGAGVVTGPRRQR